MDIARALNIRPGSLIFQTFRRLAQKAAREFAEILLRVDRSLAAGEIRQSANLALNYFTDGQEYIGAERIPREAPLLVVANHAGGGDSLGALSCVARNDSSVVAGKRPMLEVLPNVSRHVLFLETDPVGRMGNMREIIKKLTAGESVILFPRGSLEPDPALVPGALQSLKAWSQSVGIFLAKVPETRLLPLLISQTVTPKAWKNLFVSLSKNSKRRHQIAMITQFAMQRLHPGNDWKIPIRVQVGNAYDPRELSNTLDPREINASIQQVMSELLLSAYPASG
ncbi:MAG: 1-acyl-sn-glycerol-3-phosphate acyltransferase [Anaerolineaceae bacterium]